MAAISSLLISTLSAARAYLLAAAAPAWADRALSSSLRRSSSADWSRASIAVPPPTGLPTPVAADHSGRATPRPGRHDQPRTAKPCPAGQCPKADGSGMLGGVDSEPAPPPGRRREIDARLEAGRPRLKPLRERDLDPSKPWASSPSR